MTTHAVCIGGPLDRKVFASPGRVFRVCGRTSVPRVTDWAPSEVAMDSTISVNTHLYHLEEVRFGANTICFWRHESLSAFGAVCQVLAKYASRGRA